MDAQRARALLSQERRRIETALAQRLTDIAEENEVEVQQTGERDNGLELQTEMIDFALEGDLQARLAAVERAEARLAAGTFGRSVESGALIPDERLEANPLAERTIEEQRRLEASGTA